MVDKMTPQERSSECKNLLARCVQFVRLVGTSKDEGYNALDLFYEKHIERLKEFQIALHNEQVWLPERMEGLLTVVCGVFGSIKRRERSKLTARARTLQKLLDS